MTLAANDDTLVVVIDVETTGIVVARDRIYEIGMVTLDPAGQVIERFETLIRPEGQVLSSRLTSGLQGAPIFSEVAGDIVERLRRGVVAGHATAFDLSMLDAELRRFDSGLPEVPYLCTNDLALTLHVDSPNRTLGMLCHVLGVEMGAWHTALGDAEATAGVLNRLLGVAAARGLLAQARRPSLFPGSAPSWPSFASRGRTMARDPAIFPPIGEQPHDVDPLGASAASTVFVEIPLPNIAIPAGVIEALEKRAGESAANSSEYWNAFDDWGAGHFAGDAGIERLRRIVDVFLKEDEEDSWEAALELARLLRYEPTHSNEETMRAYESAMVAAQIADRQTGADLGEDIYSASREVFDEWIDYLALRQDVEGLVGLMRLAASDARLRPSLGMSAFVHRLRTAGQIAMACQAAEALSPALGAVGATEEAANVCAEWAQALSDERQPLEAVAVCERSWAAGWASRTLANRHSLLLERQGKWSSAIEVCEHGLEVAPGDDQIVRRRERCLKKAN